MGTSVDAFVGRSVGAFVGVFEGLKTGKSTLVGPVVGALVGDLVGALVDPLVGPLVVPLVGPLVGRGSLSPALCLAHKRLGSSSAPSTLNMTLRKCHERTTEVLQYHLKAQRGRQKGASLICSDLF